MSAGAVAKVSRPANMRGNLNNLIKRNMIISGVLSAIATSGLPGAFDAAFSRRANLAFSVVHWFLVQTVGSVLVLGIIMVRLQKMMVVNQN